jgi:cardiolipin synthase (CMP-forming)
MRITAADWLTLSRVLLAPIFVVLFVKGIDDAAFVIFAVAGATDLIDGTVARLFGQSSIGGALLDPFADKILIQSCFIALAIVGILPWWFVVLAFLRDAMITGGIIYLHAVHAPLPYRAAVLSKIATVFQLAVALMGLLLRWHPALVLVGVPMASALIAVTFVAAAFIVASGAHYLAMGVRILREARTQHA